MIRFITLSSQYLLGRNTQYLFRCLISAYDIEIIIMHCYGIIDYIKGIFPFIFGLEEQVLHLSALGLGMVNLACNFFRQSADNKARHSYCHGRKKIQNKHRMR